MKMLDFPATNMKLTSLFRSDKLDSFTTVGIDSPKIKQVYGTSLNFPEAHADRPYIYGSFVTSIDGKLAYKDNPGGFEVAGRNHFAGAGSLADFWWLNALRSTCDALILGAKSIAIEEDHIGYTVDPDLEADRMRSGMPRYPMNIVVSTDARSIPLDHALFRTKELPSLIACAPNGLAHIKANMPTAYVTLGPFQCAEDVDAAEVQAAFAQLQEHKTVVILTGEGRRPDIKTLLKVLRLAGIEKLLIEAPTYAHLLIKAEVFDEGFFNQSCVYIGGDAVSLGSADQPFSAEYHPHTEVLSIAMHSPHMLFFRHRFIYGVETRR